MIQEILDATTKRTKIKIDYVDREGERTTRVIRPYHAFKWHSNTYFMGFCEFDNDIRTFKISRIKKLEVLNQFSDKILSLREYEALGHFSYFRRYPISELKVAPQPRRQLDMPSTPYNVSSATIDFSQREPYRFASDSTYPKEHYSPKLVNNPATCRSPIEEEIFTILDTDPKVRSYWIEAIRIPYIVGTEQHTYTPDILVEYTNGKKILVEIKASHDIDSVLNEMKFRAAELYCEEQGIRFQIWTLERGELKFFPSWQEAVSSERQVNVIDTYAMIRHPAKPPAYDAQQNVVYKSQREAEQQTHEQYQKRKASEQEKQESTVKNTVYCYMPEAVRFVQRCWWAYIIICTIIFLGLFAAIHRRYEAKKNEMENILQPWEEELQEFREWLQKERKKAGVTPYRGKGVESMKIFQDLIGELGELLNPHFRGNPGVTTPHLVWPCAKAIAELLNSYFVNLKVNFNADQVRKSFDSYIEKN